MSGPFPRLEDLVVRHFGGELSPDEEQELASLLEQSAEARELFASYMRVEGATMQLATAGYLTVAGTENNAASSTPSADPQYARVDARARHSGQRLLWAAAACVLLAVGAWWLWPRPEDPASVFPGSELAPIAKLVRAVDVRWENTDLAPDVGSSLEPGTLNVGTGLIEILFSSGVTVIVEGPAEFELVSAQQGYLHRGKVRGVVPKNARGFTVLSPEMTVVDLGTEFGLEVDESGTSEVHVFDGEVEVYHPDVAAADSGKEVLTAGRAVRFDTSGQRTELDADDGSFVGPSMLTMVAETYMQEVAQQLKLLQRREVEVTAAIDNKITELSTSPEIVKLDQTQGSAQRALSEFRQQHRDLVAADKRAESAQANVAKVLDKAVAKNQRAKELRGHIQRHQRELAVLKKRMKSARAARDESQLKSLRKSCDTASSDRKQAVQELAALRRKLEQTNDAVQAARQKAHTARRSARQMEGYAQHAQLQRALADASKAHRNALKRLTGNDKELRSLRAESKVVSTRIKNVKREIRDARVPTAT